MMMSSDAWKELMEDISKMASATNDITAIQDEKTLHYRRGEISIMRWMLTLKQTSEQAYQTLKDE